MTPAIIRVVRTSDFAVQAKVGEPIIIQGINFKV